MPTLGTGLKREPKQHRRTATTLLDLLCSLFASEPRQLAVISSRLRDQAIEMSAVPGTALQPGCRCGWRCAKSAALLQAQRARRGDACVTRAKKSKKARLGQRALPSLASP